jgi:hypothetical protein
MEYQTQMLVMGRYLMSFARANELFLIDQENANEGPAKTQCLGLKQTITSEFKFKHEKGAK